MLQHFFGILISALYDVKEPENIHKHYTIDEEMQHLENDQNYKNIMENAFSVSLEFVGRTHKKRSFEAEALKLNIQVNSTQIVKSIKSLKFYHLEMSYICIILYFNHRIFLTSLALAQGNSPKTIRH